MAGAFFVAAIASLSIAIATTPVKTELRCADPIPATLVDRIDSATAYPGERFRFKTTAAANHGAYTIPSGSEGWGYVRYVRPAGTRNRSGLIVLEPRVLIVGELRLPVMWDPMETAQYASTVTLTEEALGYIPMSGLISSAINTARMGKNVIIGPGFNFHVVMLGEITTSEPCAHVPVSAPSPAASPSPSPSPTVSPLPSRSPSSRQ
jgi:hypothetical protein